MQLESMMEPLNYNDLADEITKSLQSEQGLILATCANNRVTARMICHINDGLTILFGTSRTSQKVAQMRQNPNVALAIGNVKIEAVAEIFGHPSGHALFQKEFPRKFPHLGAVYPSTPDDLLIIARPAKVALFKYTNGPCEDVLEVDARKAYRLSLKSLEQ